MEVILLERVEKLGQMGDVVSVKPGYARNFLLPQKKALRATAENSKIFDERKAQLEAVNLERRTEAEAVAEKLEGLMISLIRQAGEAGQLYGSVNARDITDAVIEGGFTIDKQQVKLAPPIKTVGIHDVRVDLHPEVQVIVKANVARSADEAEIQAETGTAVISSDEAERQAETAQIEATEAKAAEAAAAAEAAEAEAPAEDAEVEAEIEAEAEAVAEDAEKSE
ncbi:MAG: 50S ribosomal protein L9 [Rhodospirillales bacterium]|jgi:large subunit ribosomal protein L9|nr:50S ribosomal protein L9 [Rhodospirillales bacterium]